MIIINEIKYKFDLLINQFKKKINNEIFLKKIDLNLLNKIKIKYFNKNFFLNELANIKIINKNVIHIIPYNHNKHIIKKIEYNICKFNIYFHVLNNNNFLILNIKSINVENKNKILLKFKKINNNFIIKCKLLREQIIKKIKKQELNKDNLFITIKKINLFYNFYKREINFFFLKNIKKNGY
ncbi:MAG: ribosome recycling factor [Candidatus Shikimatogenerans sp. Ttur]|uniref:Ribosome recycling factor n=1 Tax=Candidatus Shikimatogenerans sp. Ttur TaxID=3158569 RepID=A0AAU7ZY25_9FLAO